MTQQRLIDLVRAELDVADRRPIVAPMSVDPEFEELLERRAILQARLSCGMDKIEAAERDGRSQDVIDRAMEKWLCLLTTHEMLENALIENIGWEEYTKLNGHVAIITGA